MDSAKYSLLSDDSREKTEQEYTGPATQRQHSPPSRHTRLITILSLALLTSLSVNLLTTYKQYVRPWDLANELPTRYARMRRNTPFEITHDTDYNSLNRTLQESAWNQHDIEPWNLFVALKDDWSEAHDLPHSQRWPWDDDTGVYIPVSAHDLHCVRVLRVYVNENHDEVPVADQTWQYPHVLHCLNLLRQTVMCNADDTPLYIGRLHQNAFQKHPKAGTGQVRMCRNWQELVSWTREHSACYRPEEVSERDRYRYCPDGAEPWKDGAT